MFSCDHMQQNMCMQKVEGAWNQHSWLSVPKQSPYHLPLLVCCVAVALVAVVAYHEDGDKAEGASFVAWGLEERLFLQQEESSR